jgi:hypothetical protein
MLFHRTQRALVTHQHGRIHDAVGHRGQSQTPPAGRTVAGDQRVADVLMVEIIENHPAVMHHTAIGQTQGRDLAHRVALHQLRVGGDR